jgi:hypothetical protein
MKIFAALLIVAIVIALTISASVYIVGEIMLFLSHVIMYIGNLIW